MKPLTFHERFENFLDFPQPASVWPAFPKHAVCGNIPDDAEGIKTFLKGLMDEYIKRYLDDIFAPTFNRTLMS